jgi:hypothetical protein
MWFLCYKSCWIAQARATIRAESPRIAVRAILMTRKGKSETIKTVAKMIKKSVNTIIK